MPCNSPLPFLLAFIVSLAVVAPGPLCQVRDAKRQFRAAATATASDRGSLTEEGGQSPGLTLIPKVSQELRALAATEETLHVFVSLRDQPLREIHDRVSSEFDVRLTAAEDQLLALTEGGNAAGPQLRAAQIAVDTAVLEMRKQVAERVGSLITPQQDALERQLEGLGARRIQRFRLFNMLSAEIPSEALSALESDVRIGEIALVRRQNAQLNVSAPALGADSFWQAGFTGAGETVAVLDSGVNAAHPAFGGRVRSAIFLDSNFDCPPQEIQSSADFNGHGTHVAGIVASQGTSAFPNLRGVAHGVSTLWNLKISCFNGGSFGDDVLRAVEAALASTPANIINDSNGGRTVEDDDLVSRRIDQLIDMNTDLVYIVAAGNDGDDGLRTVNRPGTAYNVITVANVDTKTTATRGDDTIANSSSRGPTLGGRFKPDLAAPGSPILSTAHDGPNFVAKGGTSMAAPHIAGAVALLKQAGVRGRLATKALLINTTDTAGWNPAWGWGYVNLAFTLDQKDRLIFGKVRGRRGSFDLVRGIIPPGAALSATVAWNRFFPNGESFLRNLDLALFDGEELSKLSNFRLQNVEQIFFENSSESARAVGLKVKALDEGRGANEPYALALSAAGFTAAVGPQLSAECSAATDVQPGQTFTVNCTIANQGDLTAYGLAPFWSFSATTASLREERYGFSQPKGQVSPDLDPGEEFRGNFSVTAPSTVGLQTLNVSNESKSYGEFFSAEVSIPVNIGGPPPGSVPAVANAGIVLATGTPVISAIAPNSIVTLFGQQFAPAGTLSLQPQLDSQGRVSTNLADTCVEIDGQRSPIFAVLSNQINLQASDMLAPGGGSVVVIRDCGLANEQRSGPASVQVAASAPGFFNFLNSADGGNPIAALHGGGPNLVGAVGLFPGVMTTPAKPGEFVSLFATGLGSTNPAFQAGEIPGNVGAVTGSVSVTIGGLQLSLADIFYAGVAPCCAGLYQFVVKVPDDAPTGDLKVVAAIDGVQTPSGPFITVERE